MQSCVKTSCYTQDAEFRWCCSCVFKCALKLSWKLIWKLTSTHEDTYLVILHSAILNSEPPRWLPAFFYPAQPTISAPTNRGRAVWKLEGTAETACMGHRIGQFIDACLLINAFSPLGTSFFYPAQPAISSAAGGEGSREDWKTQRGDWAVHRIQHLFVCRCPVGRISVGIAMRLSGWQQ